MRAWRRRFALAGLSMLALLGACATGPRTVSVSASELQAWIARRFPVERRVLEVFELRLSAPTVRLLPQDNRLVTELNLLATDRLSGRSQQGLQVLLPFDGLIRGAGIVPGQADEGRLTPGEGLFQLQQRKAQDTPGRVIDQGVRGCEMRAVGGGQRANGHFVGAGDQLGRAARVLYFVEEPVE